MLAALTLTLVCASPPVLPPVAPPWVLLPPDDSPAALRLGLRTDAATSEPMERKVTGKGLLVVDGEVTGVHLSGGNLRMFETGGGQVLISHWNRRLFRWDRRTRTLSDVGRVMFHPVHAAFPARTPGQVAIIEDRTDEHACIGALANDLSAAVPLWCGGPGERPVLQAVSSFGGGFRALVVRGGSARSVVTAMPGQPVAEVAVPETLDGLVPIGLDAVRGDHVALMELAREASTAEGGVRLRVAVFNVETGKVTDVGYALAALRRGWPAATVQWKGVEEFRKLGYRQHLGDLSRAHNVILEETLRLVTVVPQ